MSIVSNQYVDIVSSANYGTILDGDYLPSATGPRRRFFASTRLTSDAESDLGMGVDDIREGSSDVDADIDFADDESME